MTDRLDEIPKKALGRSVDEAKLELEQARFEIHSGDLQKAWIRLQQILVILSSQPLQKQGELLFIEASLVFSDLSFILGKGFKDLMIYLQTACKLAERLGDRRSYALINLNLGRIYYFAEQRQQAMDVFEKAVRGFESLERKLAFNSSGPMWLSYCYAYLGQFHQAIGSIDYYRRMALERSDLALATTYRLVLGIILVSIRKNKEAAFHLSGAFQEAKKSGNILAGYFAGGGLGMHHYIEGRIKEARSWIIKSLELGSASGIVR